MKLVVVVLILVFTFAALAQNCGTFTSSDGSRYNLAPLTANIDYSGNETDAPYTYYWQFCSNLVQTTCVWPTPVTQVTVSGTCTPVGYLDYFQLNDHPNGPKAGFQVTYVNAQDNTCQSNTIPRITHIVVDCDLSVESSFVAITSPSICIYWIEMRSKYACPVSNSTAPLISSISPPTGSMSGGTKVSFVGQNFTPSTQCRFGLVAGVNPTYQSSTVFMCTSPASTPPERDLFPDTEQVFLSNDGLNWSSTNNVTFTFK
eukprot:TRINITY_DN2463_c0_g2_i1.p1 TRINITY_DN2463_c0_g2~~TRINITY_DN2463_c0_g2_i1.p1  ORF type:complete len:259 (-),score=39.74 TRINITY_DN2463_c0_g2_i1:62-838(-)